jgi:hypothetical protein
MEARERGLLISRPPPVVEFFEDNTLDPKINHVKFHVFGRAAGGPIMESDQPIMQACFALPFPWVKGTLLPFESSPLSEILTLWR